MLIELRLFKVRANVARNKQHYELISDLENYNHPKTDLIQLRFFHMSIIFYAVFIPVFRAIFIELSQFSKQLVKFVRIKTGQSSDT